MLRSLPLQSVDNVIDILPGVHSNRTCGPFQMASTISIRGLGGDEQSRALILMDGTPLNVSDNGTVNWNSIHIDNIAKIELLRGPTSAIYGSNSVGGVINIVTKRPSSPFSLKVNGGYGSMNSWNSGISLASRICDKVSLFASANYEKSDGYINVPDSLRTIYTVPLFLSQYGIYSKFIYSPTQNWELGISYNLYRDKRGEGEKIKADKGEYRKFDNDRVQFTARTVKEQRWRMSFSAFMNRERYFKLDERMNGDKYQRFDVHSKRSDVGLSFNTSVDLSTNRMGVGAEIRAGSVAGGDYYKTSPDSVLNRGELDIYSLFIRDEQTLFKDRLWLLFVLRLDKAAFHNGEFNAIGSQVQDFASYNGKLKERSWHKLSPTISVRYTPSTKYSAYLTYGRGFRASILDDLCRSGWMWIGPKIANPDLGPEYLDNIEYGMTIRWRRFTIDNSMYYGVGRDMLCYVSTGEKLYGKRDIFIRKNISKVQIWGRESSVSYDNQKGLYLNLNYSFNRTKVLQANGLEVIKGKQLTYSPNHIIKFTALWNNRVLDLSFKGAYKSKQYTSQDNLEYMNGFVVADMAISKWLLNRSLCIKGEVQNIFDTREMNSPDYLAPGRVFNVRMEVRVSN